MNDGKKVIGAITFFTGNDPAVGPLGTQVKIIGIIRYDAEEDSPDAVVRDDEHLARLGGVRACDGADVLIWLPSRNRWGFVGTEISDITLLAAFAHLKPTGSDV